jgi:PPM family protein phosphatase
MIGQTGHATDRGRKRRLNEDSYVFSPPLFAVADGMGGAQAGEVASRLAAEALQGSGEAGAGEEHVVGLIQEANRRVYERGREDASASGLGTTITVAYVDDGHVRIGHVGDSRAYLLRDGRLEQLTQDHSLVAELVRSGQLSPQEAETHPQRSVITRALGTDPDVDVDRFSVEAMPGDVFLLCSDGLTAMVDDERILELVQGSREALQAAVEALVREANRGGGEDNITVVAFEIGEPRAPGGGDTATLPAVGADPDDDTLDELDAVPALDTMVVPPERAGELLDAGPSRGREPVGRNGGRRRRAPWVALLLVVAGAVAGYLVWRLLF